jgi:hypothetical protein
VRKIANISWLGTKELRSFQHDFVLIALVLYAFTWAVIRLLLACLRDCDSRSSGLAMPAIMLVATRV